MYHELESLALLALSLRKTAASSHFLSSGGGTSTCTILLCISCTGCCGKSLVCFFARKARVRQRVDEPVCFFRLLLECNSFRYESSTGPTVRFGLLGAWKGLGATELSSRRSSKLSHVAIDTKSGIIFCLLIIAYHSVHLLR